MSDTAQDWKKDVREAVQKAVAEIGLNVGSEPYETLRSIAAKDSAKMKARIKELEADLAKVTAAYRIEVMMHGPWTSHEHFDRHIAELTGGKDE